MNLQKINKKALLTALIFLILFATIISVITALEIRQQKQNQIIAVNHRFLDFQQQMKSFLILKTTILDGLAAYINTFEIYDDDDNIYTFLNKLLNKNREFVRNIAVLKDTTIIWNFPRENNSESIGINLLDIKEQAPAIIKVKEQLEPSFSGPINLVQGGSGYIIRVPLLKNEKYWGMVSIVLNGDKFISFLDEISNHTQLNVLILDHELNDSVMYGEKSILTADPYKHISTTIFGKWIFFITPQEGWNKNANWYILVALSLVLILVSPGSFLLYNYVKHTSEIKNINIHLQKTAGTDKLTGIPNRSNFEPFIMQQINFSERHSTPLTIMIFDLDHFKKVNDNFGHEIGDRILLEKVLATKNLIRKSDYFTRWGGEEFIIVMPNTHLVDGVRVAEKIRKTQAQYQHKKVGIVTISIGIAQRLSNEYWGSLFKRIDKALYQAKNKGRNTLVISAEFESVLQVHNKLEWNNEWLSGNSIIDEQHQQIIEDSNRLISLINQDKKIFMVAMDELYRDLENHFHSEEIILETAEYPFWKEHAAIHENLLNGFIQTQARLLSGKNTSRSILDFLIDDILIGHLVQEDLKFFHYL